MADNSFIICGNFIHSTNEEPVVILKDHYIGVRNGEIIFIDELASLPTRVLDESFKTAAIITLGPHEFIIPGFIDTHIHASQYPNAGKGLDVGLLEWLQKYTFPTESKFKDSTYAKHAYTKVVERTVKCGTTTACYFATNHTDASLLLCDIIAEKGQRALVGKVNSDQNCPDFYRETEEESISETKRFVEEVLNRNYEPIKPIITPRFAVSCSERLMKRLGNLAKTYNIPIQTHICETVNEINLVSELYPDHRNYVDVYDKAGLLTDKTVLAHGIYLNEDEIQTIKERQSAVSHCPNSNLSLRSGMLDVRNLLSQQVKVGLGTDVSGGYHPSIMDAIRTAVQVSNVLSIQQSEYAPINFKDAFSLATLGGAKALSMDHLIGNFEVGKQFDALRIDLGCSDSTVDLFEDDTLLDFFQKFIHNGDDRNIITVYVSGRRVHSRRGLDNGTEAN